MKQFMDDSFMISNETGLKLYNDYAKDMPIFDYHCHLSPQAMYEDERFSDITEIFLGGDHYKWRYMRSSGIDEEYITGDKSPAEKFKAFCAALQYAIGNPLYHWTHLELKRYFGIDEVVTANNADNIRAEANRIIEEKNITPSYLINNSNVAVICTTDDPLDSLEWHRKIREKGHINAKVLPTFRPDRLIRIEKLEFCEYVNKLIDAAGVKGTDFDTLIDAVYKRIDFFHSEGCRISDHALDTVEYKACTRDQASEIFDKKMNGTELSADEMAMYKTAVLTALGEKYYSLGWTMQLHTGAMRDNNTRMYKKLGADTGFDSVNDGQIAYPLSRLLDTMEQKNALPKTILYTLNPKDNYVLGTMLGNFQGSEVAGKIQFGSGWWFNDQRDGMKSQMKALANLGALHTFVGMLTDSRSFLSYTRHEYFRRILCDLLGEWVENGEFPSDFETLGKIVEGICFKNAEEYFGIK